MGAGRLGGARLRSSDPPQLEVSAMKALSCWVCTTAILIGGALVGTGLAGDKGAGGEVKLEKLTWSQLQKRLVNPHAKYTMVDAWSTTCGPCKENFPHVVAMNKKFAPKGLAIISLSLDDPTDKAAVAEAERFLKEKKAAFSNVLLDENFGDGFDKLNINGIPAVFIFGPDGKEVKRFTMDNPDNQFTYDEVEKAVANLLDAK
jgi:thiol-disulfide isomerase/thioredoxin